MRSISTSRHPQKRPKAAIGGGNCELTKLNETYTTDNGVTIIGTSSNLCQWWLYAK
jgi:hypothetical protein